MICAGAAGTAHAEGTITSKLVMTDPAAAKIKISGNVGKAEGELHLMMKKKGAVLSRGDKLSGKEFYAKDIEVGEDGGFEYEFVFGADTGIYEVYLSDLYNSGSGYVGDFEYISYETALGFVEDLGNGKISQTDMAKELERYSDSLGLGIKEIEDGEKKTYIANTAYASAATIKAEGISGLKRVVTFGGARYDVLAGIKAAKLSGDVYSAISENKTAAEIPSDKISAFEGLSQYGQTWVCEQMIGKDYTYDEFLANLSAYTANAPTSGGGSSGSGGSSSGKTNVSGGGYVMITDKPDGTGNSSQALFDDLDSVEWAKEAIEYLCEKGIVNGVGENKFSPNATLTREQLAKIIVAAMGCHDASAECIFADVPADSWAASYIASAYQNDLMKGVSDTEFGFGKNVTRQDAALCLFRLAERLGAELEAADPEFADNADIGDYAFSAVGAMNKAGIINGVDGGKFAPKSVTTRAQACKMIYEVMKRGAEQ